MLGPLPEFLQDEFSRNTRYTGLKFPDIPNPETLEERYQPCMNDTEIDLMAKMLEMDPYQPITARQALEHEYFDELRLKDPDFADNSSAEIDSSVQESESMGQQVESPDLMPRADPKRQRVNGTSQQEKSPAMTKKSSYSHVSNLTALEQARSSDKAPLMAKKKTGQLDPKVINPASLPTGSQIRCQTNIAEEEHVSPGRDNTVEKKSVVNPLLASVQTHGSLKAIQESQLNQLGSRSSGMSMDSAQNSSAIAVRNGQKATQGRLCQES